MKVTITNYEIETAINVLANPESFRNNISVKISDDMDWAIRVNVKAMNDRYSVYNEARQEIGKEFIDAGKVEDNQIKEEFRAEYNNRLIRLAMQKNDLEFTPIKRDDFKGLQLSMPEKDLLMLMVDEEAEKTESEE